MLILEGVFALRAVRNIFAKLKPTQIIVVGFLFFNLIGTILLLLPFASTDGKSVGFVDALFTSTSAICVTGLSVVNTLEQWTIFGKIVIMFLIQIGGIGFMTIVTSILVFLGRRITLKERVIIQESFNLDNYQGMVSFAKRIVIGTFIFEGAGAVLLSLRFIPEFGFLSGIFKGIFHSVSAFCNAGFDILGRDSLVSYSDDYLINIVISLLIIIGGLGFVVWMDLFNILKSCRQKNFILKNKIQMLSLHSKLVLTITFGLIVFGWIFFFCTEYSNPETLGKFSFGNKILASFFQSVTLRTAGFASLNQASLTYTSKLMGIILMFIGGSSGSTAGGIKTATFGAVMMAVVSVVKGRDSISVYKKSISFITVQKALTVVVMMIAVLLGLTMILSFTESNINFKHEFMDLFYEAASAVGTVGLSVGITPYLSVLGKIFICIGMFIGRLGPVTVAVAISSRRKSGENLVHYPEERIFVG